MFLSFCLHKKLQIISLSKITIYVVRFISKEVLHMYDHDTLSVDIKCEDGDDALDLNEIIRKICEADKVLSDLSDLSDLFREALSAILLPFLNEGNRFREMFASAIAAAERAGRLPLLERSFSKEAWRFYLEHYLPALDFKAKVESGKFRTPSELAKLSELGFMGRRVKGNDGSFRTFLFYGKENGNCVYIEPHQEGCCGGYFKRRFTNLLPPSFSKAPTSQAWSSSWPKRLGLMGPACTLLGTVSKLGEAPWTILWRDDVDYWEYIKRTQLQDVTGSAEKILLGGSDPERVEHVEKGSTGNGPIPDEQLRLTDTNFIEETAACFRFKPDGPSNFFYPGEEETELCSFLKGSIVKERSLISRDGYYLPSSNQFYNASYSRNGYIFLPPGDPFVNPIVENGGSTVCPVIARRAQIWHSNEETRAGCVIGLTLYFRNGEESKLFESALQWEANGSWNDERMSRFVLQWVK